MKAYIERNRMIMPGSFAAYNVYVPASELPAEVLAECCYFIHPAGYDFRANTCCLFSEAFYTPGMLKMPIGEARSTAFRWATKRADEVALKILKSVYPELSSAESLPQLWRECPEDCASDSRFVDFDPSTM